MRHLSIMVIALIAVTPISANACGPARFPIPSEIAHWARSGFLMRGRIIQGFDSYKQQPEIIRAEEVFVGENAPREFVLYHDRSTYEHARREVKTGHWITMCGPASGFKEGEVLERVLLIPAQWGSDPLANGRWVVTGRTSFVGDEHWLDALMNKAKRLARLKKRPK